MSRKHQLFRPVSKRQRQQRKDKARGLTKIAAKKCPALRKMT